MIGVELEEAINNAIESTLANDKDIEEAKTYFENMTVNEMIDAVFQEF